MGNMTIVVNTPGESEGNGLTPRATAEPRDPQEFLQEEKTEFKTMLLSGNQQHLPGDESLPKGRKQDSHVAETVFSPSDFNSGGDAQNVSHYTNDCRDQHPVRDSFMPKIIFNSNCIADEQLVLLPSDNSTEPHSSIKQNGNALSLVKGRPDNEDISNIKINFINGSKGHKANTDLRQPNFSDNNRLSASDDLDVTDESQPILT